MVQKLLLISSKSVARQPLKAQSRDSDDLDFNDVFGGPPRWFSMQEVKGRYSLGEPVNKKPVFRTETVTRRRCLGDDFFNDIFGGDESYSSPRRTNCDQDNPIDSNPGSRISSPGRVLIPKPKAFSTSFPA
ncbi:Hypothetical predicted protein [Olea europaea subsp. europaea]|uniref:Uncharacterized protein n=1 Tax=Olea europaea subsp. europaea TaxID=158383 RepID=A0A8S0UKU9_OLEEU|nr:Hypothetical predicted protein [Olea europaea subsp. europaea]